MTSKELKLLQLENRYRRLESRGNTEVSSGVMRKIARQIKNLKAEI